MKNAADLAEVRLASDRGRALVVGVRFNTLLDPTVPVVSLGIVDPQGAAKAVAWPGSGVRADGVRWIVTLEHDAVTVTDLRTGAASVRGKPTVHHETAASQRLLENTITAVLPVSALGLRTLPKKLGVYAVAGVHDPDTGGWFGQPAAYDVAFFTGEAFGAFERARQAALIESGDITVARGTVDFSVTDRPARPKPGKAQGRVYRMSVQKQLGEGIEPYLMPVVKGAEEQASLPQGNRYLGLFTPYSVWVPAAYTALRDATPLFVSLHGLGGSHYDNVAPWVTGGIDVQALAIFPLGVEPSGFFQGLGELDVVESLEDAKAALSVDADRVFLTGISMGGNGTYTVGTHRPDLFAGAVPVVGTGSGQRDFLWPARAEPVMGKAREYVQIYRMGSFGREILENALHLPFRIFAGVPDPLTNVALSEGDASRWEELGYDYQYGLFPQRSHEFFTPYVNTLYHQLLNGCVSAAAPRACDAALEPAGGRVRDENPARVVYKAVPFHWLPQVSNKLVFDGAYWVDGMTLRTQQFADDFSRIDVVSHALAVKARAEKQKIGPEVRTFEPTGEPYKFQGHRWGAAAGATSNGLDATLANLRTVSLDVARMRLKTSQAITMRATGDGVTTLTLTHGAWRDGATVQVLREGRVVASGRASRGSVSLNVPFETPALGAAAPEFVIKTA